MQETIDRSLPIQSDKRTVSPRISIIIPCYNYAGYIGRTLESIAAQTFQDWEVIVVDDGSKDNSVEVVEGYVSKWASGRLRVMRQANQYLSVARNNGFKSASANSEYLLFLDADDLLEPNAVGIMLENMESHPEASMILCGKSYIDSDDNALPSDSKVDYFAPRHFGCLGVRILPVDSLCEQTLPSLVGYHEAIPSCCFYRRTAFEKAGLWDEGFSAVRLTFEDKDMAIRAALQGPVFREPRLLLRYRLHGTNMSSNPVYMTKSQKFVRQKWQRLLSQMAPSPVRRKVAQAFIFDFYLTFYLVTRGAYKAIREKRFHDGIHGAVDALKKTGRLLFWSAQWIRFL